MTLQSLPFNKVQVQNKKIIFRYLIIAKQIWQEILIVIVFFATILIDHCNHNFNVV